jgi:transposase
MDPFHVVSWATGALDEMREDVWRKAKTAQKDQPKRRPGRPKKGDEASLDEAKVIKGARFSLWKNPEDLTDLSRLNLR